MKTDFHINILNYKTNLLKTCYMIAMLQHNWSNCKTIGFISAQSSQLWCNYAALIIFKALGKVNQYSNYCSPGALVYFISYCIHRIISPGLKINHLHFRAGDNSVFYHILLVCSHNQRISAASAFSLPRQTFQAL